MGIWVLCRNLNRFLVRLLLCPNTLFLERYYFHRRVCVSASVCVCHSIISKSPRPILMKLCRMVFNDKSSVPLEDENLRSIAVVEKHTSPKRMDKIAINHLSQYISKCSESNCLIFHVRERCGHLYTFYKY